MENNRELQDIKERVTKLENQLLEKPRKSKAIKFLIGLVVSVVAIVLILIVIGVLQFISS